MRPLSQGARGPEVLLLQRLLNKQGARPPLTEDQAYGPRTQAALTTFRSQSRPVPGAGVTPDVWRALGVTLEREHNVRLYGQPTTMTCWSAAATMMSGSNQSVGPGGAATASSGGMGMGIENSDTFIRSRGWRMINNASRPPISVVTAALARGPVWLAFEGGHFKHAVVVSAAWGDGTDTGTVLRIHDPWPQGRGTVYGTTYVNGKVMLRSISPPQPAMIQYAAAA